jgi:hypothetical protein
VLCAAVGVSGVIVFAAGKRQASDQDKPEPTYVASDLPYKFGDGEKKATAGPTAPPPAPAATPTASAETVSINALLHPKEAEAMAATSSSMNYVAIMASRAAEEQARAQWEAALEAAAPDEAAEPDGSPPATPGTTLPDIGSPPLPTAAAIDGAGAPASTASQAPAAGAPAPTAGANPGAGSLTGGDGEVVEAPVPESAQGPEAAAPAASAGQAPGTPSPSAPAAAAPGATPDWDADPVILQEVQNPFRYSITGFRYVKNALISGGVSVTNNTVATVQNAYLELQLEYTEHGIATQHTQYAYAANLMLPPGGTKDVKFAALPPVGGDGDGEYRLISATIAAFDTQIGGAPKKVFVDLPNALLEVLGDNI